MRTVDDGRPELAPVIRGESPRRLGAAFLVFVRHTSPRILIAALIAAMAVRFAVGGWSWQDLLPVVGLLAVWPIQEWLIHVCILHFKPIALWGRVIDFRVPREHRAHHAAPWDLELVYIPL